eukprot:410668-Rhodomonas_salina.1
MVQFSPHVPDSVACASASFTAPTCQVPFSPPQSVSKPCGLAASWDGCCTESCGVPCAAAITRCDVLGTALA